MGMGMTLAKVISILFFCVPCFGVSVSNFQKLFLPRGARSPDSVAFGALEVIPSSPWVSVGDGRILKYRGPQIGFVDFAYDSPLRSKQLCDGNIDPLAFGEACGRPLDIGFRYRSNELYIADAISGIHAVKANIGGLARAVVDSAEGQKIMFANRLTIDRSTGNVFFTDTSSIYNINQIPQAVLANDSTGRFIKYNPITNTTTVLLRNLSGPSGVAVSSDGSYILIAEYIAKRVIKYWLTGPRSNTVQAFLTFAGRPDSIRKTPAGDSFWVAVNEPVKPSAVLIDGFGNNLANISLANEYRNITGLQEYGGSLYVTTEKDIQVNYVGKHTISRI